MGNYAKCADVSPQQDKMTERRKNSSAALVVTMQTNKMRRQDTKYHNNLTFL